MIDLTGSFLDALALGPRQPVLSGEWLARRVSPFLVEHEDDSGDDRWAMVLEEDGSPIGLVRGEIRLSVLSHSALDESHVPPGDVILRTPDYQTECLLVNPTAFREVSPLWAEAFEVFDEQPFSASDFYIITHNV